MSSACHAGKMKDATGNKNTAAILLLLFHMFYRALGISDSTISGSDFTRIQGLAWETGEVGGCNGMHQFLLRYFAGDWVKTFHNRNGLPDLWPTNAILQPTAEFIIHTNNLAIRPEHDGAFGRSRCRAWQWTQDLFLKHLQESPDLPLACQFVTIRLMLAFFFSNLGSLAKLIGKAENDQEDNVTRQILSQVCLVCFPSSM